jgi:hypothetical protein
MPNNKKISSKTKKRLKSTENYINGLFDTYSKINVLRFDVGYINEHCNEITSKDLDNDINHMFNNMRSKPSLFDSKVGFIIKKEDGETKGPHAHITLLCNGQEMQKGAYLVDKIGEYWSNDITKGRGSYHNCNRNKYEKNGTGMIEYKDTEKKKILLENVTSYLCKDDQPIKPVTNDKINKSFTRGTLPKEKSNKGRPRKK